ncbi:unnamed protein product [Brugia timori]|uniref:G_PROTEIN_RECEP_F1_2 domain-containing protein n=1 Tax=Brugia timori TaxID=42155 RepID=A0A0R3R8M7_9BILA|nr:unnamed protein product [Brugia timori]
MIVLNGKCVTKLTTTSMNTLCLREDDYLRRANNPTMLGRLHCIIVLFLILPCNCHEINVTDVFDIRDEDHMTTKFVTVLLFIIFILYAIISNTLMIIVLFCKGQDNHYNREFIFIALQLIISDLITLIPQVVIIVPRILSAQNNSYDDIEKE